MSNREYMPFKADNIDESFLYVCSTIKDHCNDFINITVMLYFSTIKSDSLKYSAVCLLKKEECRPNIRILVVNLLILKITSYTNVSLFEAVDKVVTSHGVT